MISLTAKTRNPCSFWLIRPRRLSIDLDEPSDEFVADETKLSAPQLTITIDNGAADLAAIPDARRLSLSAPCPHPFHVEIWCEKSTMNDILVPLARRNMVNLQTATGETSLTRCRDFVQRCKELVERSAGRPIRIIFISDFDPGGESMPVVAALKIEWLVQKTGLDIQLQPVLLTKGQCERYRLPRTPIKETEGRAARFEERHGEGATELDALEALRRGIFRQIVQDALDLFRSGKYVDAWQAAEEAAEEAISDVETKIHERHGAARDALEERLADIKMRAEDRLSELQRAARERAEAIARLVEEHFPEPLGNLDDVEGEAEELAAEAADLTDQIDEELESEAPSVDDFDWPDPDEGFEDPLFDSTREYVEQIDRYKNHQGKRTTRKELERTYSTRKCVVCKKPF
jgi:hypothetical protein